jgi:hypothetical protein
MSEILYLKHPGLAAAETQTIDSCLAIANESGLQARIQRLPTSEPNTVNLAVQLFPPLLETFERSLGAAPTCGEHGTGGCRPSCSGRPLFI